MGKFLVSHYYANQLAELPMFLLSIVQPRSKSFSFEFGYGSRLVCSHFRHLVSQGPGYIGLNQGGVCFLVSTARFSSVVLLNGGGECGFPIF